MLTQEKRKQRTDVILHAFNWNYKEIIERTEEIRDAGYGAILIPPPIYSDRYGDQCDRRSCRVC